MTREDFQIITKAMETSLDHLRTARLQAFLTEDTPLIRELHESSKELNDILHRLTLRNLEHFKPEHPLP